jgi:hypothetical protein
MMFMDFDTLEDAEAGIWVSCLNDYNVSVHGLCAMLRCHCPAVFLT